MEAQAAGEDQAVSVEQAEERQRVVQVVRGSGVSQAGAEVVVQRRGSRPIENRRIPMTCDQARLGGEEAVQEASSEGRRMGCYQEDAGPA